MSSDLSNVNPVRDNIAARIGQRLREQRGVRSQEAFAKEIGVSFSTLRRFESGERVPDSEQLIRICRQEQISANWLFGGNTKELSEDERSALGLPEIAARRASQPVSESRQAASYSIDPALMRSVIEAALKLFQEEQLHLPPAKFAELCLLAYELERNAAEPNPKARVVQLMRLAA